MKLKKNDVCIVLFDIPTSRGCLYALNEGDIVVVSWADGDHVLEKYPINCQIGENRWQNFDYNELQKIEVL